MKTANIFVGADPELFVAKNGIISHCIGLLGGDKEHPRAVGEGAVQEDNVLFEFNINPSDKEEDFVNRFDVVMDQGKEILGNDYEFTTLSSHIYSAADLAQMPESAFVFGCDPDFNALTGNQNPRPSATDPGLRSAGGHVHLGWDHLLEESEKSSLLNEGFKRKIILLADYYIGMPLTILDPDNRRRELYGKAGAYRSKSYGAEYRTPSNFWIHDKDNRKFVFNQAQNLFKNHEAFREMAAKINPNDVQAAINSGNKKLMETYVKQLNLA